MTAGQARIGIAAWAALTRWPDRADAGVIAAAVLGPLVLSGWIDGPAASVEAVDVMARVAAGLAARRLLARHGCGAVSAAVGAGAFAAIGMRVHAPVGAAAAVLLWAVAAMRGRGLAPEAAAACGTAAALAAEGAGGVVAMMLPGLWAFVRVTGVSSGLDGRAAVRLLAGAAAGVGVVAALRAAGVGPLDMTGDGYTPASHTAIAATAAAVAAWGCLARGRGRTLAGVALVWALLCLGRALDLPVASFLLDIPVTMLDAAFLDRAVPVLALGTVLVAAPMLDRAGSWRRALTASLALAASGAMILGVRAPTAEQYAADGDVPRQVALALPAGGRLTGTLAGPLRDGAVTRVGIEIGTFEGRADGMLEVALCTAGACRSGRADLRTAADNAVLFVALDQPLATRDGAAGAWQASHVGGTTPVAIWLAPATTNRALTGPDGAIDGMSAHLVLFYHWQRRAPVRTAP